MSTFNITLVLCGWANVNVQGKVGDGTTFAVDINGEPRLFMNGTEVVSNDAEVKLGKDGARAAVLALLEDAYRRVQSNPTSDAVVAMPTQPGADA